MIADDRILVGRQPAEARVVAPGLLHELELAADAGVDAEEMDAARLPVVRDREDGVAVARRRAVSTSASNSGGPKTRARRSSRCASAMWRDCSAGYGFRSSRGLVRRMCAPIGHARPSGSAPNSNASRSPSVGSIALRRLNQRRAARPAADHLRRQPDHVAGIGGAALPHALLAQRPPEAGDVLLQLAVDDERSVAAEIAAAAPSRDTGSRATAECCDGSSAAGTAGDGGMTS